MKTWRLIFLFLILLASSIRLQAQESIYVETGVYAEMGYNGSFMATINPGWMFLKGRRVSIAAEANIYKFFAGNYSSIGLGLRPAVRYYPVQRPKYSLYAEIKGGPIYMFPQYPSQAINFTFLADVGTEIKLPAHNALIAGFGYTHFSNGKREGQALNDTWDGFGPHIGIIHSLR